MKILYIITKSEAGGAQTHIWQLSKYMKQLGNEVAVMAGPEGWLEDELRIKNKELGIRFYPNRYFKNSFNPFLGIKAMREVKRAVDDFKPDLVSCHSTFAGFWTRLCIKNKIPTIFTAHGWSFAEGMYFLRKNIVILAEKLASRYCSKIICVSEYDNQLALKYRITPEEKIMTIHNGVEITNHKPQTTNKLKAPNSKLQIVFVGRLDKQKDSELLLEAFSELPDNIKSKAEVLIIGDGPKLEKLQTINNKLQIDNVRFLGGLPREKVFEILRESDVFVLISNWEGFPRSILEAMSCALPVIASDVGGVSEALTPEIGFLIKRGDKERLKKALTELIENKELREKMGRAAHERVEKEFSLERMLKKTFEVYRNI